MNDTDAEERGSTPSEKEQVIITNVTKRGTKSDK